MKRYKTTSKGRTEMERIINTKGKERNMRRKKRMKKKEVKKTRQGESISLWNQKESIRRICDQAIPDQ
jgi:hypothetical protein